jgi:sec-independent protein translocase protein TatC
MATVCFVGGAAFNHYVVFPLAWVFLASFSNDYMMMMPRIEPIFSLYAMMMLAMGLVFEMPAVILVMARMGMVTAGFLWRHVKYAILIIFIAAAVITPTGDMVTQSLMAGPMVGLYFLSIGLAWMFGKKRRKAEE